MAKKKTYKFYWIFGIILAIVVIGIILFFATRTSQPDFNCGNGICDYREDVTCQQDCSSSSICGDSWCDIGEVCESDCHNNPPQEYCGDGICQASRGESKYECPLDCGLPLPICGNGKCEVFHYSPNLPPYSSDIIDEFEVCPQDCGGGTLTPPDQQNNAEIVYSLTQKQRPLVGGLQIEMTRNSGVAYCSLGAIVNYNGKNYVLTAGHCVTKGEDGFPDPEDIGLTYKQGGEVIGQVYKTDFTGGVDVALLSINSGIDSEQKDFLGNEIEGFGTASIGLKVYKIGRTTGLTYGTINEWVGYTGSDGKKWKGFEVKGDNGKFSESGDSGSAIITVSSPHKIVGIISAGDGSNLPEDIKSKLGL